jgi:hypothetical protein
MTKGYTRNARLGRFWVAATALVLGALPAAQAQTTPSWSAALAASQPYSGSATALATVADASGNVYIAGSFSGQIQLGTTTLVSAGGADVFVAKWNTAASTWTWVVRAGGSDFDAATALVLSGSNLYLTGYALDNAAGTNGVTFGTLPLPGKGSSASRDLFVAKLVDAGTSASFAWALNGGGTRDDAGASVAVSGSSVYVAGGFVNDSNNSQAVTFGTLPLNGLSPTSSFNNDVVVAKITDAGTSASFAWALAAGGTNVDQATSLAVNGSNVYAAGFFTNTSANANGVTFGAAGMVNGQSAAAGSDIFVTKITDAGATGAFSWVQVAGGAADDRAAALVASSGNLYTAGYITNTSSNASAVTFGAAGVLNGLASTSSQDMFVAKLTDGGTTGAFTWAQAAGGFGADQANALVANGTALYVSGSYTNDSFNNNVVTFGTLGTLNGVTATSSQDVFVTRLTDAGSSATWGWAQAGGGPSLDNATGLAVRGSNVYPAGNFSVQASFGSAAGSPLSSGVILGDFYVSQLTEAAAGTSASWARVAQAQVGGSFASQATAADANGNVYVAGYFLGRITLGGTTLTAAGATDAFVAKWNPATNVWVWALAAGGLGTDQVLGLAASGGNVYATGYLTENNANLNLTRFGSLTANGMASSASQDAFVTKIVDAGASATWNWVQVAGGAGTDQGRAIAASGTSLYAVGYYSNSITDANVVTFGTASLPGLSTSTFGNDVFVSKLSDAGSTGSFAWTLAGGGAGADQAKGVAINGSSVYVTGYYTNNAANANTVVFGPASLAGVSATTGNDVFVSKLTDAGSTGSFAWTLASGGASTDQANALAVNGSSVYVAGYFTNNAANANVVAFGPVALAGASTTTGQDAFVAKLTDAGTSATWSWAAAGGGTSSDQATAVGTSGTSVYVAGNYLNTTINANTVVFGNTTLPGYGTTLTPDMFLAKYADAGTSGSLAWVQQAGSPLTDQALGLAVNGARLYLAGFSQGPAMFSTISLANSNNTQMGFAALLNDVSSPLATTAGQRQLLFSLYPNPARGTATVVGLAPKASLQLLDLLGRTIANTTADATGTAALALPAGLSPGVYLVRSGTQAERLTVE